MTCAFYFPITPNTGFDYLITLYFLYSYSTRLETGVFGGCTADYAFLLLFNWAVAAILALTFDISLLFNAMVYSVLYTWCYINKNNVVQFWFGTQFKAALFPWILLVFSFIVDGSIISHLVGYAAGHLYFFLKFKWPMDFGGTSYIDTPNFMYRFFPRLRGARVGGFGSAPISRRTPDDDHNDGQHRWGPGHRLGG